MALGNQLPLERIRVFGARPSGGPAHINFRELWANCSRARRCPVGNGILAELSICGKNTGGARHAVFSPRPQGTMIAFSTIRILSAKGSFGLKANIIRSLGLLMFA
jgi:hypothetical protein